MRFVSIMAQLLDMISGPKDMQVSVMQELKICQFQCFRTDELLDQDSVNIHTKQRLEWDM
jgi:hypothetical protein